MAEPPSGEPKRGSDPGRLERSSDAPSPRRLRGLAASVGVSIGPAVVFDRKNVPVSRRTVSPDERDAERERLRVAIEASRGRVRTTIEALDPSEDREHIVLLEAYAMLHRDELLVGAAEASIARGQNAEWAVRRAADDLAERLRAKSNRYLAERANDILEVGEAILRELTGLSRSLPTLTRPSILVALDLSPAEILELPRGSLLALVTEHGATTSHTSLLARALHIPTIVGVRGVTRLVPRGSRIVVDAFRGEVTIGPDEDEEREAERRSHRHSTFIHRIRSRELPESRLASGERVDVLANIELELEVEEALTEGVDGIGLYRTEFLYLDGRMPTEEELVEVFRRVRARMHPRPVTLRTFDLGADKLPHGELGADGSRHRPKRETNPALGLRGLRLSLARASLFRTHLRAMLRAAADGPIRAMFPMVASLEDLDDARALLRDVEAELTRDGVAWGPLTVGAMIEVPSAVELLAELSADLAFFSIGTNDLAQYTLAVDRQNPDLTGHASPHAPALVRMLCRIAEEARASETETTICGDIATHPLVLPLLIGAGFRRLSVPPSDAPIVRELVSRLDRRRCEDVLHRARRVRRSDDVRRLVMTELGEELADICEELGIDIE